MTPRATTFIIIIPSRRSTRATTKATEVLFRSESHNSDPPSEGRYSLAQNYPNPFSGRTYISYQLGERSPVELTIKDTVTNKEILIVQEMQDAGTYIVSLEAKMLAKGKYMYKLKAGSFVATRMLERGE